MKIKALFDEAEKLKRFQFNDAKWDEVLGQPGRDGLWLIQGPEKHGKTTFCLELAKFLSGYVQQVLFVNYETGVIETSFVDSLLRVGIQPKAKVGKNIFWEEFLEWDHLIKAISNPAESKSQKPAPANIVFIDNITYARHVLKEGWIEALPKQHKNTLFIYVAHEEGGEVVGAEAKAARRLAKIIFRVDAHTAYAGGRCPGGNVSFTDRAPALHGHERTKGTAIHA
ncbi:hypothetical protein [Persicobacter sp. CCB-QB2]|uniref:hypothetical protein n=1 Tax=Persicobacter sp. CCB-QB2 TaxID=1561025 RepID=UPI0006A9EDBE|nr:hypothetical protein [Persicobacter sp. CCB-QB2]